MLKYNINIIIAFFVEFEDNIKTGCLKSETLLTLENNKIKIFKTLIDYMNLQTVKFIRSYVMRLYNDCSLLSFGRGMKDIDNNYYLLRIKDILLDLFFCVFSSKNMENIEQINIQDIFISIHLVTEVGNVWLEIKNYDNRNDLVKKIECILNYLKIKPNDMCTFVNQDLEYYNYLIDYFDFYLNKFVKNDFNEMNKNENKIIYEEINTDLPPPSNMIPSKKEKINLEKNGKIELNSEKQSKKLNNTIHINVNDINSIDNDDNKIILNSNSSLEEKVHNLSEILFLLNNINFRSQHEKTKHLILTIIKIINDIGEEDTQKQIEILEAFYALKYKENLNKKILHEIQILYINALIQQNKLDSAEEVIKSCLKNILPNTREEEIYFLLNFYLMLEKKDIEIVKLGEMMEIVIQHCELKIEDLNELLIRIYNHEKKYYLIKLFCDEICYNGNNNNYAMNKNGKKNNEINNKNNFDNNKYLNSKIELNFNTLQSMPDFVLLFNYIFIEAFIHSQENPENILPNNNTVFDFTDSDFEKIMSNETFFELIKVMSEALLENCINNLYEEHKMNVPILLHNLIYLILNKTKNSQQNNFANYFLIDIINKFKKNNINLWKDFSLMSIQLYIEKKDYNKLKNVLNELESDENEVKHATFIFAKIISVLGEGIKWNSINIVEQMCQELNEADDFETLFYIKIFRFIYDNKINDIFLLSIILEKYCEKCIEIYNIHLKEKNDINNLKYLNYNYSLIDCCYEVIFYCSHFSNFCAKIDVFCDILEKIGNFLENLKLETNNNYKNRIIVSNISVVTELIKLFISFKNLNDFKNGKYCFPDYILSTISKLLNFVFLNFENFFTNEFLQNLKTTVSYEILSPVTILFSFFQNSKIFSFASEIKELISEKMKDKNKDINNKYINLKDKYKQYQQNFVNAIKVYTNIIQDFDEKNAGKKENLIKPRINEYLTNIYKETKIYDEIIMIKLTVNSEKDNIKNYISNIINKNYQDKKFMQIINSVLFCENCKELCFFLISELLNKILITNTDELFNKIYSTNDIFELYKELLNVSDENDIAMQIKCLKNYQIFLCKLVGKIDDNTFYQNTEWIYYQIFLMLEKNKNLDKKTMNYSNLKAIFDEINNTLIGKEKTLVIEGLVDLIIKKTI